MKDVYEEDSMGLNDSELGIIILAKSSRYPSPGTGTRGAHDARELQTIAPFPITKESKTRVSFILYDRVAATSRSSSNALIFLSLKSRLYPSRLHASRAASTTSMPKLS